ncbi:MAG TPA: hypothetical protein VHM19_06095, partial [Polyangiales bacterium]|nr:hypothetical protein [Polyangiales bacterium]
RLPDLPAGFDPNLNGWNPGGVYVLPFLIKFAPGHGPWLVPGGDSTVVNYEMTVAGPAQPVQMTWR